MRFKKTKRIEVTIDRHKISKDSYVGSSNPETKTKINVIVAHELKKTHGQGKMSVVLESEQLLTLKTLKKVGFDMNSVFVPNNVKSTYEKIKRNHPKTRNQLLGEFLKDLGQYPENKGILTGLFADFCCSIKGNKETSMTPMEELEQAFKYDLFSKDSFLAVTFSYRAPNTTYTGQNILRAISLITFMGARNNYTVLHDPEKIIVYKGLFFIPFQIVKS